MNYQMVKHILADRNRIEANQRSESAKLLCCKDAVVQSRLSYHLVKLEVDILVRFILLIFISLKNKVQLYLEA